MHNVRINQIPVGYPYNSLVRGRPDEPNNKNAEDRICASKSAL